MTAQEIKDRLLAENVTLIQFVCEDLRPIWLGNVECMDREYHEESADELENESLVFHLVEHDVHLRISGTKEDGTWEYWFGGFSKSKSN